MLSKKITKSFIAMLLIFGFLFATLATANAATYQTWCTRGVKYLCWSKCTIDWTTNSTKITSYDTDQKRSGILVQLEGCKKLNKSTSKTYYINSKTELLVGAEISGVSIGWATTITDQATIKRDGSNSWQFDV